MVFLRSPFARDLPPILMQDGVELRVPEMADYETWAALRLESRAFLVPWEPAWPQDDLTRTAFRSRVKRYIRDIESDSAYPFFVYRAHDDRLMGAITLSNVRRGVAQAGSVGYWIGSPFVRQGYMTSALNALMPFAFGHLHLHRIEAACLPVNQASIRLLTKCEFRQEGLARRYLKINGRWEDHLLFARLADDR
ncbi:GNAT family N-acetyltransferase [Aestuariivirga sp. YIM B02566]|jgi:[ribosomal protein S5]-alanine N-acetyltransferase|uniref:GNAT family N-acetyltransferase n=1 Tax=Taklimakanibacter albus TaxID=2800327 RepID=A0ACC5RCW8_9HYPH|nr:GNAT family protein [Aestuariivirga sp. YIM B02566]MBK1870462.1 GNAT family N-acetyltransferase [Aestuariivirga sp. YIM B02566]